MLCTVQVTQYNKLDIRGNISTFKTIPGTTISLDNHPLNYFCAAMVSLVLLVMVSFVLLVMVSLVLLVTVSLVLLVMVSLVLLVMASLVLLVMASLVLLVSRVFTMASNRNSVQ